MVAKSISTADGTMDKKIRHRFQDCLNLPKMFTSWVGLSHYLKFAIFGWSVRVKNRFQPPGGTIAHK